MIKIFMHAFSLLVLLLYNLLAIAGSINPNAVSAYIAIDKQHNYPRDSVVFIGSSSIKRWNTLAQDMYPMPIIQRGFNAAKLVDINQFLAQLVIPHNPKQVVIFAGVNDLAIAPVVTANEVFASFLQFVDIIHTQLQDCIIYFIAISPAPARWGIWPDAQEVNQKVKDYATQQQKVVFIETEFAFLNKNNKPRIPLFAKDGIHLNEDGYAIWKQLVSAAIAKPL
jgi:hypothetical protein